jgi:catalase
VEKTHIVNAFRFELSRVQTAAVRERMVSGLMNVAPELAEAVASGLGMRTMPAPMPKVLQTKVTPEVTKSPALSLFARPGDGSVRARRVAIIIGDGVDGDAVRSLAQRLADAGAVPRFVGSQLGDVASASGDPLAVDVSVEATPSVLYDAVVVAEGGDGSKQLAADGRLLEFLKDQYRHCKPVLALGCGSHLLDKAGIPTALPSGKPDPGLRLAASGDRAAAEAFIQALAKHRHFEREMDPPRV